MELAELKLKLKELGPYPAHISGSPLDDDRDGYTFIGTFEEYLEAVRAVGPKILLIATESLDEENWLKYTPDEAGSDDNEPEDSDIEPIDLCSINPALHNFKSHLGQIGVYKISAEIESGTLDYYLYEDWWTQFTELWKDAISQVDEDLAAAREKSEKAQEEKNREAIASLNVLIHDPDFVRLPTQKAMIAYAMDRIGDLAFVGEMILKNEIQNIHAKIKAKGLDRRR